jgi:GntR family transcriptional regulator, transcriptional repressor for pyruvate dehydrogenase complex
MNEIVRFAPRQKQRAFEHIVEQIRNLIYNGIVKAGERLPSERELAEQFQTARLAVREAFRVLEESGLIYIKKGKMGGAYIRELNSTRVSRTLMDTKENEMPSMEDLMEARAYIENIIVGLAIERMKPGNLRLLKKNIAEAGRLISGGVSSATVQVEFHILLARTAGNATLEIMLQSIMNVLQLFLLKEIEPSNDHLKRHLDEHKNILKAIQEKKPGLAKKLVEKHIQYFTKHFSVSRRHKLLKYKS